MGTSGPEYILFGYMDPYTLNPYTGTPYGTLKGTLFRYMDP